MQRKLADGSMRFLRPADTSLSSSVLLRGGGLTFASILASLREEKHK